MARADARDLLWEFAYSECHSVSRHGDAWRAGLGAPLRTLVEAGAREKLTPPDWEALRGVLLAVRGWYLKDLLGLEPTWERARVGLDRLGRVRLIRHEPFRAVAPNLLLEEFVRALDHGADTPGDRFADRYRRLRPRFEPSLARGVPVLVQRFVGDALTEVDGLTRMSILLSRRIQGEPTPESIEVLLGTTPRLAEWTYY